MVIAAGYPKEMKQFLASNPGLESRFTRFIHFDDYHVSDMCQIFQGMCETSSYALTPAARATLAVLFNSAYVNKKPGFGNARHVRNVFETTLGNHADRLASTEEEVDRHMLSTIEAEDIPQSDADGLASGLDLSSSKWKGACPGCQKVAKVSVEMLGRRVRCRCGTAFIFPWWNMVPSTMSIARKFKQFDRPEDLIGIGVE